MASLDPEVIAMSKTPLTLAGAESIRAELAQLTNVERRNISQAIAEARAHGDLKENAEYHAAKEQQGMMEAKIRMLEAMISNAQIIDVTTIPNDGKVIFGATVVLIDLDNDKEVRYQIVGEDEADLKHNKISYKSPIARAIIGKFKEDEVVVVTPGGELEYEIADVLYI